MCLCIFRFANTGFVYGTGNSKGLSTLGPEIQPRADHQIVNETRISRMGNERKREREKGREPKAFLVSSNVAYTWTYIQLDEARFSPMARASA